MSLGTDFTQELDKYRRCLELEEKSKQDALRCLMLEAEVGDLRKKNEELEGQITAIRKIVGNGEKEKGVMVDLMDEEKVEDKFLQLMIENKVLECEKTKAETDLRCCKEKVKELELRVLELESKVTMNSKYGSPKRTDDAIVMLSPNPKLAPSTPGFARRPLFRVMDICDENANYSEIPKVKKVSDPGNCVDLSNSRCSPKNDIERTNLEHSDEENIDDFERDIRIPTSYKRKRASNIITSEDEKSNEEEKDTNDFKGHPPDTINAKRKRAVIVTSKDDTSDDDNTLICTLRTRNSSRIRTASEAEVKDVKGQRLTRLRKLESRGKQDKITSDLNKIVCLHDTSSSEDEEDNDGAEEGSESEGDSMGGFIVESSASDSGMDSGSGTNESEDESDEFKVTIDKIRKRRASNMKWELEGDMLADFGKDPELCMKAVCALYRQQTMDEKASKGTIYRNERGFSHTDAFRGSRLGEFLTEGDSSGNLNKTVEELKRYDPKGIKLCMKLAAKYSKQLFTIYQNKEDPYFLPG